MSLTRGDVPWDQTLSKWDRDCRWSTHLTRILTAEADDSIQPRFQTLEGSRKITWFSILDVKCPICGADKDQHCK